jgi:hypothetical protein
MLYTLFSIGPSWKVAFLIGRKGSLAEHCRPIQLPTVLVTKFQSYTSIKETFVHGLPHMHEEPVDPYP